MSLQADQEQPRAVGALSANDSLWLNMDTPENLMVIETVMWFDHRLDPEAVTEAIQRRVLDRYPVFGWRPRVSAGLGDRDEWVEDPDFDIHRHVSVHELGGTGGRAELQQFLEAQFSQPIPLDAPLWRAHIIEGRDFGAVMIRFHHAIADGTALVRVLLDMTTDSPDSEAVDAPVDRVHPADVAPAPEAASTPPAPGERPRRRKRDRARAAISQAATLPVSAGVRATTGTARLVEMLDLDRPGSMVARISEQTVATADTLDKLVVGTRPDTVLFGPAGVAKRADWAPAHDLAAVKRVAKSHGATVNDLMLAGLAGGLRRYLQDHDAPMADVMTMIPVNLRPPDEPLPEQLGNRFALVALMLPIEAATPAERLAASHARMEVIKSGPEALLTFGITGALGVVGTWSSRVSRTTQEYFANKAIGVTTNVPGPAGPRYLAGQRMVGILGWVPGAADQAIGVCIFSYDGQIRVGFKTDARVVPDVERLVAAYTAEMDQLLALAPAP